MSAKSSLFGIAVILFAAEAVAQPVPWEGGQPVFGPRTPTPSPVYHERRPYPPPGYRGYRDNFGAPAWRPFDQGWWGYEPPRQQRRMGPAELSGGPRPDIAPAAPEVVAFPNSEPVGTVIIDSSARRLYYTLSASEAYAYPVSVGREGFAWTGTEKISRITSWPDWYPPAEMRQRQPELPKKMTGGLRNPLGAKALYLGDTLYRIHGTNETKTIGQAASSGCFRMRNEHVLHLASLVGVGTTVKVVSRWPSGGGPSASTPAAPQSAALPVSGTAAR